MLFHRYLVINQSTGQNHPERNMNLCTTFHVNLSSSSWGISLETIMSISGGIIVKGRELSKSVEFILWGPWMFEQNFVLKYHVVVEILQARPKWWTNWLTLSDIVIPRAMQLPLLKIIIFILYNNNWNGSFSHATTVYHYLPSFTKAFTFYADDSLSYTNFYLPQIHCPLLSAGRWCISRSTMWMSLLLCSGSPSTTPQWQRARFMTASCR